MSIFHSFVLLLLLPAVKFSYGVTVWTVQSPFRLKVRWHYIPFHARVLKAMSDENRLRILDLLREREYNALL